MRKTNKILKIIAYYLSEFDMDAVDALGFKTRTEAFNVISNALGNDNNYLKFRRDEFDALPDSASPRKGWKNRPPAKDVVEIAAHLKQFSFDELTEIVKSLINNIIDIEEPFPPYTPDISIDTIDEEKLEHIINFSDSSAKLISITRNGTRRIYNQSIITQLKKLYRGACQICGNNPVSDFRVNICEAHHIDYFSESQNNNANNIIILCPNHHRLIHRIDLKFDAESLVFHSENNDVLTVKLDYHLKQT